MSRQKWKTWLLIFLSLAGFAASTVLVSRINHQRQKLKLDINTAEKEHAAAELQLPLAAMFVFRPLAIDYLWIRADKLKNDGQYFDALHLAEMICELQPHMPAVWDFQSWNMAYNISVAMPTPPERWNWIWAGYTLLRDKALYYNPTDPLIHSSMAWIFQNKIGSILDDYNRYYKLRLAFEVMPIITEKTNEEFQALAQTPHTWDKLKNDPDIVNVMTAFKKASADFKSDEDVLEGMIRFKKTPEEIPPAVHQVFADFDGTDALKRIDRFVRARELREVWKMDIDKMIQINKKYGPIDYDTDEHLCLDWRLPWPHAIYWATEGLRYAKKKDFNETRLHRNVYQSLQDLYHYGHCRIFTTVPPPVATKGEKGQQIFEKGMKPQINIFLSQDLRMFKIAYQATLDIINLYSDAEKRLSRGIMYGSINMAESGIVNFYLTGHQRQAMEIMDDLRKKYPDNETFKVPIKAFIRNQMRDALSEIGPKDASDYINSLLRQSYMRYALRDDENATIYEKLAEQVQQVFWEDFSDEVARLGLPDFSQMRWQAMKDFMDDPQVDFNIKGYLLKRLQVEDPEKYKRVIEELKKEKVIPEQTPPPGN